MIRFLHFLLTFVAALTTACGGRSAPTLSDFKTAVYMPSHASGFDIRGTEKDASTLITIRNPWQGGNATEQHLLVLRNGVKAPAGFDGQAVKAPARRVVCMSSSHVAMFDAIGEVKRVCGVSGIDYISNPYIQEHRLCGEVRDVGRDTNLNFELLTVMRPDILLLYGVTGENTVTTSKLRELGISYIYIGDYVEESPLGKAEWLVLIAELCDLRERGVDTLQRIVGDYQALKAQPVANASRPKVMLNTPYRDTWFLPSTRSYMIRLIEDAGGEYVYTKNDSNTSTAVDMEEAYLLANAADYWLNVGPCNTLTELTDQNPKFSKISVVQNRKVYNNNRRQTPLGGSDFWESGVVRPDLVLRDLRAIFSGNDPTYYYKRLE